MGKKLSESENSTRNYGLDVLRCTAMIMVVILHFLDKGGILRSLSLMSLSDEGTFSAADTAAWLLEALCIVAVNLFLAHGVLCRPLQQERYRPGTSPYPFR